MTGSRRRRTALAIVVGLVLAFAGVVPALASTSSSALIVHTDKGDVLGRSVNGSDDFLGIPYAAPPVGALRWRAPQPHGSWSGVRDARQYGARCTALESTNGARTNAENCLFVNVYRPTGTVSGARLPVYVFLHGGGLVNGSSNQAGGEQFVRETNAVTVSLNYRLGVFGFLGLPGLSDSGTGNYGFLDQQAALRWVQRNIRAFGGDPSQVTLDGESAGGFSVCGHLVATGSRGLFVRAMLHSGSCLTRTLQQTRSDSAAFEKAAGCSTVACLRAKPAADLLDDSTGFSPTLTSGTSVFPVPNEQAVAHGNFVHVPIVNGSNRDEGRTFSPGFIGGSRQDYRSWVEDTFPDSAPAVLAEYPWPAHATKFTAAYLVGAVITDSGVEAGIGGCAALATDELFAKYVPTYAYEFDARNGPGLQPIPGYVWGAGHAAELAYLFPSFDNGTPIAPTFDAGERQLSRDMTRYWGGYVFTGSPQAPGRASWPRFDTTHQFLSLRVGGRSQAISLATFRAEHRCSFWDQIDS